MYSELKKDDASLQKKSSDRHRESRSHVDQDSDLLSGETTEGFTSSPSRALPPSGQGQLVMQCKGLSENPEPTRISGQLIQRRVNNTGLPDNLKNGIENLSGYSMDDVKVHYNSSKPAQLRAYAYTQGTAIHVAPGQEQHLPHEASHMVQQKQGWVPVKTQFKNMHSNNDAGLEQEADMMGSKALAPRIVKEPSTGGTATIEDNRPSSVYQRKLRETMNSSVASMPRPIKSKAPKGSSRFRQIAMDMGKKHGVDTSGLVVTQNSSFPARLNAEATIQGSNIHFAPGMDTDYNIKHEVAHAIDNKLNGTPAGNKNVSGHMVDTTREHVVEQMASGSLAKNQNKGKIERRQQSRNTIPRGTLQCKKKERGKVDKVMLLAQLHTLEDHIRKLQFDRRQRQERQASKSDAAVYYNYTWESLMGLAIHPEVIDALKVYFTGQDKSYYNPYTDVYGRVSKFLDIFLGKDKLEQAREKGGVKGWKKEDDPYGLRFRTKGLEPSEDDKYTSEYFSLERKAVAQAETLAEKALAEKELKNWTEVEQAKKEAKERFKNESYKQ